MENTESEGIEVFLFNVQIKCCLPEVNVTP